jgi:uncharacterized protein YndB with AHSA1/START domain
MADRTRGYAHRIDIDATPERVWRALTDPALLARWCARGTSIKAREGGSFIAPFEGSYELDANIDVFLPGRRLRLVHMAAPGLPPTDSVIVDDFMIEGSGQAIVRLLGSGFPEGGEWDDVYRAQRRSWERALARLKVLLEKRLDEQGAAGGGA